MNSTDLNTALRDTINEVFGGLTHSQAAGLRGFGFHTDDGAVERALEEIYGTDYKEHVHGVRRGGSASKPTGNPPGTAPAGTTNLEDGTMLAVYRRNPDGTWRTHTLFPNPHPSNK